MWHTDFHDQYLIGASTLQLWDPSEHTEKGNNRIRSFTELVRVDPRFRRYVLERLAGMGDYESAPRT